MRDERPDPDQVELGGEGQAIQVRLGIDRQRPEPRGAEVDAGAVEVAGGDLRVAVVRAQPAQHAAVAARQVEDVGVVRLVAELAGKLDQLERAPAEGEVLLGIRRRHHTVARREGAVDGERAEIVEGFHGREKE